MNARERFLAVMNFGKDVRTLMWEMGYWKETIDRWYREGLPKRQDVTIGFNQPAEGIRGESYAHDDLSLEKRRDVDVHDYFRFDKGIVSLPVNSMLEPPFAKEIFEETEDYIVFQDDCGVKKKINKKIASIPQFLDWPAQDRRGFESIKERMRPSLKERVPSGWKELLKAYSERD